MSRQIDGKSVGKFGCVARRSRRGRLHIAVEAEADGFFEHGLVLEGSHSSAEIFVVTRVKIGRVLTHQAELDIGYRNKLCKSAQARDRIVSATGENEMADDDALLHHTVFVKFCRTEHIIHKEECLLGALAVVGGVRVFGGKLGGIILEIGEVDIDESAEKGEAFDAFVASAVPYDGDVQLVFYQCKRLRD